MTQQSDSPATQIDLGNRTMVDAGAGNGAAVDGASSRPAGNRGAALIGVRLNDLFEIMRFIAQGGMGEVYEGRNIASGERVAIKIILPQFASDEQFFSLFRREATALEKLAHPALVKYRTLAFDRTLGIHYLAMEYVEGLPLEARLKGEPAVAEDVVFLLRRLAQGLAAAHEVGVIHRDLSPDNVLLPDGDLKRAKIIDFGITKDTLASDKSIVGDNFAGKLGYAAPEVFGEYGGKAGNWTDIYSLALVVLALARGAPLDMGNSIVGALQARRAVPDLDFLSPRLRPVFARMLAPNPRDRYPGMADILADLDRLAAASAQNMPAQRSGADEKRGSKSAFALIAFVLTIIVAAAGWFLLKPEKTIAPAVAPTAAQRPDGQPAEGQSLPWSAARPQLAALLRDLPCSDVRIAADPADGAVPLAGWRPAGAKLPDSLAGWRLDQSGLQTVAAPGAETCQAIDAIRRAAQTRETAGFAMPAYQAVSNSAAPKGGNAVTVNLGVSGAPSGLPAMLLVSIDDKPLPHEDRIVSGDAAQLDLAATPFERKVKRYLIVMVAGRHLPHTLSWPMDAGRLRDDCAPDACAAVSGWVDVTP